MEHKGETIYLWDDCINFGGSKYFLKVIGFGDFAFGDVDEYIGNL